MFVIQKKPSRVWETVKVVPSLAPELAFLEFVISCGVAIRLVDERSANETDDGGASSKLDADTGGARSAGPDSDGSADRVQETAVDSGADSPDGALGKAGGRSRGSRV